MFRLQFGRKGNGRLEPWPREVRGTARQEVEVGPGMEDARLDLRVFLEVAAYKILFVADATRTTPHRGEKQPGHLDPAGGDDEVSRLESDLASLGRAAAQSRHCSAVPLDKFNRVGTEDDADASIARKFVRVAARGAQRRELPIMERESQPRPGPLGKGLRRLFGCREISETIIPLDLAVQRPQFVQAEWPATPRDVRAWRKVEWLELAPLPSPIVLTKNLLMSDTNPSALPETITIVVAPREKHSTLCESLDSLFRTIPRDVQVIACLPRLPPGIRDAARRAMDERGSCDLHELEEDVIPHRARAFGAALVSTPWLVFCDNDLAYEPEWLDALGDRIKEDKDDVLAPLIFIGPPAARTILTTFDIMPQDGVNNGH